MSGRYANSTEVSSDRSRTEIEKTLRRYGADGFMYGWHGNCALISFTARSRQVRFEVILPNPEDRAFTITETGRRRSATAAEAAYEQAVRQRWRALALVVKAKLEAVEIGITTFDDEFLAHLVLPGGTTVADAVRDKVADAYRFGIVGELLPTYRALPAGSRP